MVVVRIQVVASFAQMIWRPCTRPVKQVGISIKRPVMIHHHVDTSPFFSHCIVPSLQPHIGMGKSEPKCKPQKNALG